MDLIVIPSCRLLKIGRKYRKMYVSYNKNSKIVSSIRQTLSTRRSEDLSIAECDNIPQIGDYFVVENIKEAKRTTIDGKVETYHTCEVVAKFYEYSPEQLEAIKQRKYKNACKKKISKKYLLKMNLNLCVGFWQL